MTWQKPFLFLVFGLVLALSTAAVSGTVRHWGKQPDVRDYASFSTGVRADSDYQTWLDSATEPWRKLWSPAWAQTGIDLGVLGRTSRPARIPLEPAQSNQNLPTPTPVPASAPAPAVAPGSTTAVKLIGKPTVSVLNIRSRDYSGSEILGRLTPADEFEILVVPTLPAGWYKIKAEQEGRAITGYVLGRFIQVHGPAAWAGGTEGPSAPAILAYAGLWSVPGSNVVYRVEVHLNIKDQNRVDGHLAWTLSKVANTRDRKKLGRQAKEIVRGIYDPKTRSLNFEGRSKNDPHGLIGLDKYELTLSKDGRRLTGRTWNHGRWNGRLEADIQVAQ